MSQIEIIITIALGLLMLAIAAVGLILIVFGSPEKTSISKTIPSQLSSTIGEVVVAIQQAEKQREKDRMEKLRVEQLTEIGEVVRNLSQKKE